MSAKPSDDTFERSPPQLSVPKLDEAYAPLAEIRRLGYRTDSKAAAGKVHGLLNAAFSPLVVRLHERLGGVSETMIRERAQRLENESPIRCGDYVRRQANIDAFAALNHVDDGLIKVQDLIHNIAYGSNSVFYELDTALKLSASRFACAIPERSLVTEFGGIQRLFGLNITPVGAYGEALAKTMVRTTRILIDLARESLRDLSREIALASPRLLTRETARARSAVEEKTEEGMAPLGILLEGILTLNQVLALLLMEKVPGVDDGAAAIHAIVFQGKAPHGLLNDFTARVPLGVTGPSTIKGLGFDNQLARSPDGQFFLTDAMKEKLRVLSDMCRWATPKASVCPMASLLENESLAESNTAPKKTGIQTIAEMYWQIFNAVPAMDASEA
jgi:hypothetical protein